eukprot:TRINITY_DN114330_c0_g1_i1.p1 TRINITY_DN114330_c0_g1~~TRINITY_DN114330_c0_g1_i1.p1  ORF type:complete len:488 (-),score=56.84 TRINITY_DN114330_c0_g1_i1:95-1531(-)
MLRTACSRVQRQLVRKNNHQLRWFTDTPTPTQAEEQPTPQVAASEEPWPETPDLKPKEVVELLDNHIIGQKDAKKAVAVALRNRWRRHHVVEDLRDEILPKNILMVGPTGVGKTEIARRLAKITEAPFLKVEATKFTEVGFVGRDVESIIVDLHKVAIRQTENRLRERFKEKVREAAKQTVLEALCGNTESAAGFREALDEGTLDDTMVEIDVEIDDPRRSDIIQMLHQIQLTQDELQNRVKIVRKKMPVKEAIETLDKQEMEKLIRAKDVAKEALRSTEQDGIVVIDEIDKIVVPSGSFKGTKSISDEGVQQDLLPLIEGTTVTTKEGVAINTNHILFICSGAFHQAKPNDMLAELQGRLPIRVELQSLGKDSFKRILTEPRNNLIRQHVEMLKTEEVEVEVTEDAIEKIADIAYHANNVVQNIGARRLITVVEKVVEEISFEAPDMAGQKVVIDAAKVHETVGHMMDRTDYSGLIL